jgi:S-formylglutathione hydrolase FrmB
MAADDGARIIDVDDWGPRTRDLTVDSPAVGTVKVRMLLPRDYDPPSSAKLPVLMLLHGGGGEYTDWTQRTSVEKYTAPAEVLVVMPAAASSYMGDRTPSPDSTRSGRPMWETFHLTELPQLLQRNWNASPVQAVAGLSLGGYGAVMYTARHPGMFAATASFSGVLDVTAGTDQPPAVATLIAQLEQLADEQGWTDVNPIELISELSGATLYISYGNGDPGPLDPTGTDRDDLEAWVGAGDENFVTVFQQAGLHATIDAYGAGTHSWAYWDRELKQSLPTLLTSLGAVQASPAGP